MLSDLGYGDITPISSPGKVIGMLTIIIGVLFISVFTAAMSALYMEKPEEETREALKNHLTEIKRENKCLKKELDDIKEETNNLNKKIDDLTEMLNKD